VRLFDAPGADAGYDRWQEPPDAHEEDGCAEICHAAHVADRRRADGCVLCDDDWCDACDGRGWEVTHRLGCAAFEAGPCGCGAGDRECGTCGGSGRKPDPSVKTFRRAS
jgi:hypothetical protein